MKKYINSFFIPIFIAVTMLLGTIPQNIAQAETSIPVEIKSHFYTFKKYDLSNEFNYQWIVASKASQYFALSSDTDFGVNTLSGGGNPKYLMSKLDLSDIENPVKLGEIDIDLTFQSDNRFRITGFQNSKLKSNAAETIIFTSYVSSSVKEGCRYLNLISFLVPNFGNLKVNSFKRWYRSPCFPFGDGQLHQSGGAILENLRKKNEPKNSWKVFLTIGDFTGVVKTSKQISEKTKSILGSLIEVETSGKVRVVASGFRNSQGISWFAGPNETRILTSEHGPRGGDELNLIVEKGNFGWPNNSFGTRYAPDDVNNQVPNTNTSGSSKSPLYAWVPSVGTSIVHQIKSLKLLTWWADAKPKSYGDVLVAGMASQTLYRHRILENRVVYSEPIWTGLRIRTLIETIEGDLIIGADGGLRILKTTQIWSDRLGLFMDLP
jgi:hypothetical protein